MSHLVIDAAYPPPHVPPEFSGVLGYIGGAKATHVWTLAEWLPFRGMRQFPAYVPDMGADPVGQGIDAVMLAEDRGWAPHLPGAAERVIVFDTETGVDRSWWARLAAVVLGGGFIPVDYGSLGVVLGNAAADVLAAEWDGVASIPAGQTIHGVQYAANVPLGGTKVDHDLFDSWLFNRGGVGPRHG